MYSSNLRVRSWPQSRVTSERSLLAARRASHLSPFARLLAAVRCCCRRLKAGIQGAQSLGDSARQPLGGVWGKEAWEASRDHLFPYPGVGRGRSRLLNRPECPHLAIDVSICVKLQ